MTSIVAQTADARADFVERSDTPLNHRIIDAMIAESRAGNGNLMPPGWSADDFIADTVLSARATVSAMGAEDPAAAILAVAAAMAGTARRGRGR